MHFIQGPTSRSNLKSTSHHVTPPNSLPLLPWLPVNDSEASLVTIHSKFPRIVGYYKAKTINSSIMKKDVFSHIDRRARFKRTRHVTSRRPMMLVLSAALRAGLDMKIAMSYDVTRCVLSRPADPYNIDLMRATVIYWKVSNSRVDGIQMKSVPVSCSYRVTNHPSFQLARMPTAAAIRNMSKPGPW